MNVTEPKTPGWQSWLCHSLVECHKKLCAIWSLARSQPPRAASVWPVAHRKPAPEQGCCLGGRISCDGDPACILVFSGGGSCRVDVKEDYLPHGPESVKAVRSTCEGSDTTYCNCIVCQGFAVLRLRTQMRFSLNKDKVHVIQLNFSHTQMGFPNEHCPPPIRKLHDNTATLS